MRASPTGDFPTKTSSHLFSTTVQDIPLLWTIFFRLHLPEAALSGSSDFPEQPRTLRKELKSILLTKFSELLTLMQCAASPKVRVQKTKYGTGKNV